MKDMKKMIKLTAAALALILTVCAFAGCSTVDPNDNIIIEIHSVTEVPVPTQTPSTEPPLETVAPTPTAAPDTTPVPVNTPLPAPDYSVFDNCAFVGNSTFEGLHAYYPTCQVTATIDKASGHITFFDFDCPCILHFDKATAFIVVTVNNTEIGLEFLQKWSIAY